jgi:LEA14-like dessication related protein
MNYGRRWTTAIIMLALGALSACSTLPENVIGEPEVKLRDVQVMGLGFQNQTFLLSFDISNPNPFPLPVNHVSYGVRLDGQRFASGQTASDISVPAGGESRVAISVELDLLSTAPRLLSIVRDGTRREIPYQLEGQLGIDIPLTPPVTYRTEGLIRLDSSGF